MIYEEKNTLDKEFCNDMISWFENKVISGETGDSFANVSNEFRNDSSISSCNGFGSFQSFYTKIKPIINKHVKNYLKELKAGRGSYDITGWKIQKSTEGGGYFKWHSEVPIFYPKWENVRERFGVWMIYLNDTDTGYTDFYHQNLSIKPETGKLVIWPAYHTHRHRANPDLKEDKYIITGWLETNYERNRE
jgi:hypothetical protein